MDLIILALLLIFGFFLRLTFSIGETSDEWTSFWHIQRQKKKNWVNYQVGDTIVPGIYGYPILQHFIVSRLPEKYMGIVGRMLNVLYDIVSALIVYAVTWWLSLSLGISAQIAGLSLPLAATLLFLTAPILLPVTSRLKTIKARSMGSMLTTLFFAALGISIIYGGWPYLIISVVLGLIIILSSQFAIQVMVFFSLFLSLYLLSYIPLLVVLAALVIGYVFPRVGGQGALRFLWHHKVWYVRNYTKHTTASNRNNIKDFLLLPKYAITNFSKLKSLCFYKITPIIALYSAPVVFILMAMWVTSWSGWYIVESSPALKYLWGIVLASLVTFVLTSFPQLSFLGQAERYFEYSAPAFSVVFVILLTRFSESSAAVLYWSFLLFHIIFVFINFIVISPGKLTKSEVNISKDLQEVIDWFSQYSSDTRIFTIPCKLAHVVSTRFNGNSNHRHQLYYRYILREGEWGFKYTEEDTGGLAKSSDSPDGWMDSQDVLRITPQELFSKYGATHLLIKRSFLEGLSRTWKNGESEVLDNPVFTNKEYLICKVPQI